MRAALVLLIVAAFPAAGALQVDVGAAEPLDGALGGRVPSTGVDVDAGPAVDDVAETVPDVEIPAAGLRVRDGEVAVGEAAEPKPATAKQAAPAPPAEPVLTPARSVGLAAVLATLLAGAAVAVRGAPFLASLFSRIDDDALLDNPVRRRIVDAVTANPGISLKGVATVAGVAWGTTVRHVRTLERRGLLSSVRAAGGRHLFLANTAASRLRGRWAAVSHPTAARIARYVRGHPGADQQGICRALDLRNPAASKHLTRLERLGLVDAAAVARRRVYTPTPALDALLAAVSDSPIEPVQVRQNIQCVPVIQAQ